MGDSILSQAEIDALLNGDSEVKDEPTASVSGESDIRPYDPNTQRRVVRERLQALEIINERFARHFRMGLFNLLRRSPDITVGAIRIQPYHEFARNLPVPTNLNLIHLKPLRGTGLVVFSPSLVFIAVDNLFVGDGRFPTKVEGREFTHTEQRVINRMLKLALEGYSDAWKAINPLEVEYVRSEMQVKFTNITTSPNDIVVNTPFHVEIGNLTGEFNICLPFSMIEPLRELLVNPPLENSRNEDQNWRDNLVRQVQHSQLELVANFADISLRLSQILKLKPGDVLPIEKPDRIIAHVDGVPVLTSQYGTLNGQYALRIEHLINPNNPADDNNGAMDDLWAEALSEQKSTSGKSAADAVFQQFGGGDVSGTLQDIDLIMDIPVKLTVELGRTRMTIKELLRLTQGSVVALDGLAGEPLDILINGYLIAQGEVVVVADKYGVRITDIITPSERMRRLSR